MRRFELGDSYWEIEPRDDGVQLRWGSKDRPMQRHGRAFASADDIARYVDQQIATQLAKGYVEVRIAPVEPEPVRDDPSVQRYYRFEIAAEARTAWRRYPRPARFFEVRQRGRRTEQTMGQIVDGKDVADPSESAVTDHTDVDEATRAFDVEIEWADEEGWKQVIPDPRAALAVPLREHADLEARCLEAPDDPGPWGVYADWLMQHGDPRGEIAAMSSTPGAQLEAIAKQLRAAGIPRQSVHVELAHGFVRGAVIGRPEHATDDTIANLATITELLLASPFGRLVESLRFGLDGRSDTNNWAPALKAVIASPIAARVRELRFDAYGTEDSEISWVPYGDFTGLLAQLPALELVHIKSGAGGMLGPLDLPSLRTFIRESGGLRAAEIASIAEARWPRLEHLEIWFGSSNYGAEGTIASIQRILDARDLPRLVHLGLVNCEFVEEAIEALAYSVVLPQLHSLDLSKGILARRGVALLREHAPAFRHLASIDLSQNLLAPDEVAEIRERLDNVIVTDQRERDVDNYEADEADGERVRYVAVGE